MSFRSVGIVPDHPSHPVLYSESAPGIPGAASDSSRLAGSVNGQVFSYIEFAGGGGRADGTTGFCTSGWPGTLPSPYMMSCGLTKLATMKNGLPVFLAFGAVSSRYRTLSPAMKGSLSYP